ncbi:riboflavin synthase [Catenovulum sp. SM1970]|uniref:riboflavin synthase n=1 Tax=Marinifaba aquimaris TaxID=2741323 RepID=UPI0015718F62|nr:riboflavin synthase [Marinifaba aquimaris]NTS77064.1 riboflavin synthase [Marinifaba aquimaris]
MFTGIIASLGSIKAINAKSGDFELVIAVGKLDMSDVQLGDSIAVNGTCLTVTAFNHDEFSADVSSESIKRTKLQQAKTGDKVNLEKACTPDTRLGGHIVSGHVDGVGQIINVIENGSATDYWVSAPDGLAKYIAEKGSITVDGISLTSNEVSGDAFRLTIIPHTAQETTIKSWQIGTSVNLEVDVIARYLERLMSYQTPEQSRQQKDDAMLDLLVKSGFTS